MILVTILKNYIHLFIGGVGRYSGHSMYVHVRGHPYILVLAFYYLDPRGQTEVAVLDGKEAPLPAEPSASTCYHSLCQILCVTLYDRWLPQCWN